MFGRIVGKSIDQMKITISPLWSLREEIETYSIADVTVSSFSRGTTVGRKEHSDEKLDSNTSFTLD